MYLNVFFDISHNDFINDLYNLLSIYCIYENNYYLLTPNIYKQYMFNNNLQDFLNICNKYYKNKKYLLRENKYNNFLTIIRQICKYNNIEIIRKIVYYNGIYGINYYIKKE